MGKDYRIVERVTLLVEHFVIADDEFDARELVAGRFATEYDRLISVENVSVVSTEELEEQE